MTDVRIIVVTVRASDGSWGRGFSWTPTIGGEAVTALLRHDITPFVLGRPADPSIWRSVWEHLHEAGGGGVTTIALAGLDLALWDRRGRVAGRSLVELLGRRHDRQPVYGSGINRHYPVADLLAQARRWVAAGVTGVKIKVGRDDLAEDVERVAAVREVIGPDRALMVDANQRYDLDRALAAAQAFAPFDIAWFEEPLRAEDTAGHVALRRAGPLRIALGENVHTVHRFADLIAAGACDVVQPNVVRVGGITPFREIAELVESTGLELAPHLLPELSGQLALTRPGRIWVEDVEDADLTTLGVLATPARLTLRAGWFTADPTPGLGLDLPAPSSHPPRSR